MLDHRIHASRGVHLLVQRGRHADAAHKVVGSPNNTNYFEIREINGGRPTTLVRLKGQFFTTGQVFQAAE